MRLWAKSVVIAGLLFGTVGCDALVDIFMPTTVTVRLVNSTAFDVEAEIYISDRDDLTTLLITELGDKLEEIIPAGTVRTFSRSCEDLQAIVIDDADLLISGGLGPEADTDVLLDGKDFSCGDTITFTFSLDGMLDLNIAVSTGGA